MSSLLVGTALALIAAALYGLAVVLQAGGARQAVAAPHAHAQLARRVIMKGRWQLGALVGALGWLAQAAALSYAPLMVVQPALALSLAVMLIAAARSLHEPVGAREWGAVAAIIAGIAGLVAVAPATAPIPGGARSLAPVLVALGIISVIPLVPFRRAAGRGRLFAAGAGSAFALAGLCTKLFVDARSAGAVAVMLAWLGAVVAASAAGTFSEALAFRVTTVAIAAPIVLVLETAVPSAAAVLLGAERPAGLGGWALLAGSLAVLVAGTAALAASPAVDAVIEAGKTASAEAR